jgi:hypothetical protein
MNDLTMGPLPAKFKLIKNRGTWTCGVSGCFGRLAYVVTFFEDGGFMPGEPEYEGPFLILQPRMDERPDGTFAKTRRGVPRSKAGRMRRKEAKEWKSGILRGEVVTVAVSSSRTDPTPPQIIHPGAREMIRDMKEQAYDPNSVRLHAWGSKDIEEDGPLSVCCPGCGRMNIISVVIGSLLDGTP